MFSQVEYESAIFPHRHQYYTLSMKITFFDPLVDAKCTIVIGLSCIKIVFRMSFFSCIYCLLIFLVWISWSYFLALFLPDYLVSLIEDHHILEKNWPLRIKYVANNWWCLPFRSSTFFLAKLSLLFLLWLLRFVSFFFFLIKAFLPIEL